MIRFILCCVSACSLTGCGLSVRQAQNLSDGLAGIEAAQPRVAADPVATAALAGAHDHVEATAEGEALPPPKRTPTANARRSSLVSIEPEILSEVNARLCGNSMDDAKGEGDPS